jgi:putative oxidoreductase
MTPAVIGLWALRIVFAGVFVLVGVVKFPGEGGPWVRIFELIGFGQWFRYFTGVIEVLGGVLLLIPRATPFAAAMLAPTMVGALLTHVFLVGVGPQSVVATVLLIGVLALGWQSSRWRGAVSRAAGRT